MPIPSPMAMTRSAKSLRTATRSFNTINQLQRFDGASASKVRGLRVNPRVSTSEWLISDPARPHSRLGEWDASKIEAVADKITGFMFHNNCENDDFDR